jgi:tetrahydromethanopterin S-methyltransferase subunit A
MTYEKINFIDKPQNAKVQCGKIPVPDFPVEKGAYILGNEYSPVAVVIPMPNHFLAEIAIEAGAAIAGHLVTANIGIEKIIANIIANPNIRYLIICGRESKGHLAAQSLISLFMNGIDENGRILGSLGLTPYLKNIPKGAVDRLREQLIYLIDLLGVDDPEIIKKAIKGCIQEPENAVELNIDNRNYLLYDPGALDKEPMIVRIYQKLMECGVYETLSPYSTVIHVETIPNGYLLLIDAILSAGNEVRDERGTVTKELLNVQITIKDPVINPIPRDYRPESWIENDEMAQEYLERYAETYFIPDVVVDFDGDRCHLVSRINSKALDDENLAYTYGTRLRKYQYKGVVIDQLEIITHAILKAIEKGQASRRFVLSLVNPFIDMSEETEMLEIPCFTQFWLYNRFEGKKWILYGTMFFRSHDAQFAFPANCYAGMKILSYLCKKTGCEMGSLTMFFGSAHIYVY